MSHRHWPLHGLRIRTPRLELRLPDEALLDELASVGAGGVHAPDRMPFIVPWTDGEPSEVGRATYQHVLGTIAGWTPQNWHLSLAVLHGGEVVGRQDVMGREFGVRREVMTGSWLGLPHQGQGIGTEMRAAALHLAFEGLGARYAVSDARTDNAGSLGVSRRLGYEPDGLQIEVIRGEAVTLQRVRLERAGWEKHRSVDVTVEGLDACRADFGV
ncbi:MULTISPECIES: GNAT family N-acetyltransferase [Streptomyces]|uniref:GNAT family N-acetyltransferase n=1 Tax=Streptomyces TaxID=1883 RepID=UPI0004C75E79|nr:MULTISPECIES: GNAT family protein [Streptomyces]NDZ64101.1 GNAT family N-acetyltransferase [Streptomyces cyaneofuscatus]ONI54203.1 putative succinyl-CoA transferase [Streptomyces sp. IB2014 011-1]RDV52389.1 N-acetyltransferase [Streptomyces sp. IB2014 011-12]CAD5951476.1 Putative succinyl-CoA transferase [Streptomyces sp. KY75]CAD5983953.1 Putative succinyl-CoA transferase [Streptomyces sp. KY70]